MARLADIKYRFPAVDEWTNLAFVFLALAPLGFWETWAIVPASVMTCVGSWLWHRFENVRSRRFDELGMMMLIPAVAVVVLTRAGEGMMPIFVALPIVWGIYYTQLDHTSSFVHIGAWSAFVLAGTVYLAGLEALIPAGLTAFALWGQFSFPWNDTRYEHGIRHGLLWHVPIAGALFSALFITA